MSNFDEFFKDKLSERAVEFNEQHWEGVSQLLDKEDKKRRRILILLLLLLCTLLTIGIKYFAPDKTIHKLPSSLNVNKINTDKSVELLQNDEKNIVQTQESDLNKNRKSTETISEVKRKEPTLNISHTNNLNKVDSGPGLNRVSSDTLPNKNNKKQQQNIKVSQTNLNTDIEIAKDINGNHNLNSGVHKNKPHDQNIIDKNNKIQEHNTNRNIVIIPNNAQDISESIKVSNFKIFERLPGKNSVMVSSDSFEIYKNITSGLLPLPLISPEKKGITIGLAGNYEYMPNIQNSGGNLYQGGLGIYINKPMNHSWSLTGQLTYHMLYGDIRKVKQNTIVSYSFDRMESTTEMEIKSGHYLSLGVGVEKKFGPGSLIINAGFQKLTGVKGKLLKDENVLDPRAGYNESVWLKNYGLNKWNLPVNIGYEIPFYKHLSAGLHVGYLINGIYDPNYKFPGDSKINSSNKYYIRMTLKYKLFNFNKSQSKLYEY